MKSHIAPRRLSEKEAYQTTQRALECVAPAVVAAVLYVLYKRGWHKDRLCKLYDDIIALFDMPAVFGQYLDNEQVQDELTRKCGIDWNRLVKVVKVQK
jgi:hypothetical protein